MKITRENYEVYFLDYLEGNLDENLVDDFLEFLKQNPDLKMELALMDTPPLEPFTTFFSKKEKLYKEKFDSEKEFNRAAIALIEGDITETEKAEFNSYLLKYPEKQKEVQLFQQTKLRPDKSVGFAHKNKLYRRSPVKTIFLWSSRAAAVLIVALAIYFYIDQSNENIIGENQVAVIETPEEKETPVKTEKAFVDGETDDIESIGEIKTIPGGLKNEVKRKATPNLREAIQDKMDYEKIAATRIPVVVPSKLSSLEASLQASQQPEVTLAAMTVTLPENYQTVDEERFLADVVKEKTGLDNFSFRKITKAGLNLVSSFSKKNFNYETNEEGKVTELNYDSRLLAFSIPTKND